MCDRELEYFLSLILTYTLFFSLNYNYTINCSLSLSLISYYVSISILPFHYINMQLSKYVTRVYVFTLLTIQFKFVIVDALVVIQRYHHKIVRHATSDIH